MKWNDGFFERVEVCFLVFFLAFILFCWPFLSESMQPKIQFIFLFIAWALIILVVFLLTGGIAFGKEAASKKNPQDNKE